MLGAIAAVIMLGSLAAARTPEALADSPAACGQGIGQLPAGAYLGRSMQKQAMARKYYQAKVHGHVPEALAEIETYAGAGTRSIVENSVTNISKTLYPNYQEQQTIYYCGPASAWIVNNWVGVHKWSRTTSYLGEQLTQANLASSSYLATTTDGTVFSTTTWPRALNKWWNGSESGWYYLSSSPSLTVYQNDLVSDIDAEYPLVLDVHMSSSNGYLVGYTSGELWHYVVANGYGSYGTTTDYTDPYNTGNGSLGWHFGFSSSAIATLIHDYGMVW